MMMTKTCGSALLAVLMFAAAAYAQGAEADLKKIADDFSQAWAKGDAKAIAALHTQDAMRFPGDGQVIAGRAAIEQNYAQAFGGAFQGSTITITPGQTKQVTADVYVGEGRYQIAGASLPPGAAMSGQYVNTYVRQGGRWLVAASVVIPPQAR